MHYVAENAQGGDNEDNDHANLELHLQRSSNFAFGHHNSID
jgi:hypothetical protein